MSGVLCLSVVLYVAVFAANLTALVMAFVNADDSPIFPCTVSLAALRLIVNCEGAFRTCAMTAAERAESTQKTQYLNLALLGLWIWALTLLPEMANVNQGLRTAFLIMVITDGAMMGLLILGICAGFGYVCYKSANEDKAAEAATPAAGADLKRWTRVNVQNSAPKQPEGASGSASASAVKDAKISRADVAHQNVFPV